MSDLREAREQAGLTLAALGSLLKVPTAKLEALEEGRYTDLPDLTFARALAKSVCRTLKLDPAPVLAAMPAASSEHALSVSDGLQTPFPQRISVVKAPRASSPHRGLNRPLVFAVCLFVLALVLWFVLPQDAWEQWQSAVSVPVANTESVATLNAPETTPTAVETPVAATEPEMVPAPEIETPAVAAAVPVATEPSVPVLTLQARASSWVQVVGASGQTLLQRQMQTGELLAFNEDVPLTVVVGHAAATEVKVRGEVFDIAPFVRNQVARFVVK